VDEVDGDIVDHSPDGLVYELALLQRGVVLADRGVFALEQAHVGEAGHVDETRPQPVVDVVIVVGDLIGQVGNLRLETRLLASDEALPDLAELARLAQRAVLEDPLAAFERQIEPTEIRVAVLELVDHPQRLQIVLEAAIGAHASVQRVLPGMAERCVPQIVRKADRLRERLVEPKRMGNGAGDLCDLDGMGDSRAIEVALVVDEHLRLVHEAPESIGMDDPVAVALVLSPQVGLRLGVPASARVPLACRVRREF